MKLHGDYRSERDEEESVSKVRQRLLPESIEAQAQEQPAAKTHAVFGTEGVPEEEENSKQNTNRGERRRLNGPIFQTDDEQLKAQIRQELKVFL